jgi:hypothetical protein
MEANASRYHGKAPGELDWTDAQRQKRAVAEYLAGLEAEAQVQEDGDSRGGGSDGKQTTRDRKPPKVISPSDPSSAWTAKANKRVQFGYGLNYLIDVEHAIIVDVEATPARTYNEVASTKTMIERTEQPLVPSLIGSQPIPPKEPANCLHGCWAKASRRISRCGKDIHRLMACSPVANSRMTLSGTSMSAPMASSCEPRERSMMAASGTTCHNQDCRACTIKQRCTRAPFKKIARDINEDARNHARSLKGTPKFERWSNARKKVAIRFAHLKVQHGFERMRLRGLTGARDEFHLAAICHCAEPQDNGAAPSRPATKGSLCGNCLRG